MEKDFEYREVGTGLSAERALDVATIVASLVPLIGGPVASILSGISGGRREQRVLDVIRGVSDDLQDFKSQAAEEYVKTEDFVDLLESTLRRVAQETSSKKRQMYRQILTNAIKQPAGNYDEQGRFLRTLDELDADHLRILQALLQPPESDVGIMGSPMQTVRKRIPEFSEEQIQQLVDDLNDRRITTMNSLQTMMTAHGAADLQHSVTPYGRRFLAYVQCA